MDKTCATCRFYSFGNCHRYPPKGAEWSAGKMTAIKNQTTPDYWCGEHKERDDGR